MLTGEPQPGMKADLMPGLKKCNESGPTNLVLHHCCYWQYINFCYRDWLQNIE